MAKSDISSYLNDLLQHERILLLQGPMGGFFAKFAQWLQQHGKTVTKINFNGGDWLFYKTDAINYRGSHADWQSYFEQYIKQHKPEAIVLFGQERPIHSIAQAVAIKNKVAVYIFEEGYIRPDLITLEQDGVNAASTIPREAEFYQAIAAPATLPYRLKTGQNFWRMAYLAIVYTIFFVLLQPWFWWHQYHRSLNPISQLFYWCRGGLRKLYHAVTDRSVLQYLISAEKSKTWFLVPLQVSADSQIKRHSKYDNVQEFIAECLRSFAQYAAADASIVFKHHPMDRAYNNYSGFIRRLSQELGLQDRVFYVYDLHLPTLLKHAKGLITINSTVGLQALSYAVPTKVMGEVYYDIAGLTEQRELAEFWQQPSVVDTELLRKFRYYLHEKTQLNGSFYANTPFFAKFQQPEAVLDRKLKPRSSWQITKAVWNAMLMRELVTRVSGRRAAWFWLLLEPIGHVAFLMLLFSFVRRSNMAGVDFSVFLAIGIMGLLTFRKVAQQAGAAINANKGLLSYRQITVVDTVIVRIFLEGMLQAVILIVLLAGIALTKGEFSIIDPLAFIESFVALWLFGAGLGLIFSVLFTLIPETEKVVNLIFSPLYFMSAVMYSLAMMPVEAQQFLLYNPLVHGVEYARAAVFPGYHLVDGISMNYLFGCGFICVLLGLMLQRKYQRKLAAL